MNLSFGTCLLVSSATFTVGVAIGAFLFDCFVSRPTLRILNEEIKLREISFQKLFKENQSLYARNQELVSENYRNRGKSI